MAVINEEVLKAIEEFRAEHGEKAAVTTLMKEFPYWRPIYRPRQGRVPTDKREAEKAALQRALFHLAQLVDEAASNKHRFGDQIVQKNVDQPVLNIERAEFPIMYEVNDVARAIGASVKRGTHTHEDYDVRLDDDFRDFTLSLSVVYGGPKGSTSARGEPTAEFVALKEAVANASQTRSRKNATTKELREAIDQWLAAYRAYANKLRALKGTLPTGKA